MKTIKHEGKIYELNCVYGLADGSKVVLDGFNGESFKVSRTGAPENFWFATELYESDSNLRYGKITNAPVELIDGDPYMFDYKHYDRAATSINILAYYKESDECFAFNGGSWAADRCVNIVRLVPEEK